MSGIRVTYSGLVSLVMALVNVIIGIVFLIIMTRTLSPTEFGTWTLINSFIFYIILVEPVISYWTTRQIARGIESGKTALVSSGIFSIIGIFAYLITSYFVGHQTNVDKNILIFAAMLVPVIFVNKTLMAINLGWKPHAPSYASVFFVIIEVVLALILVYFLHMGLLGVILTVTIAYIVSIVILFSYAKDKIKNDFNFEFLKKWIHLSWLPLYPAIASIISVLDAIIFSLITGSVTGLGFWSAATANVVLVTQSIQISRAVYPKLLESKNREYLRENINQLFYFAIPFTTIAITFAKPGLFVLNPIYMTAVQVVIFIAIWKFFDVLSLSFQSFLTGIETVDLDEKSTFKSYMKSKLFFVPTLALIQSVTYVILLISGLLLLKSTVSQLDLLVYWSIIGLITQIPLTIYLYLLIKRNFNLKLDLNVIIKYLLVSVGIFGIIFIFAERYLDYNKNIFEFLPVLVILVGIGMGGYMAMTYFIDSRTRNLFKSIIQEIKNRKIF